VALGANEACCKEPTWCVHICQHQRRNWQQRSGPSEIDGWLVKRRRTDDMILNDSSTQYRIRNGYTVPRRRHRPTAFRFAHLYCFDEVKANKRNYFKNKSIEQLSWNTEMYTQRILQPSSIDQDILNRPGRGPAGLLEQVACLNHEVTRSCGINPG